MSLGKATYSCSLLRPQSVDLRSGNQALAVEILQHMPNDLWQFEG